MTVKGAVDPKVAAEDDNAGWKALGTCDTTSGVDGQGDKTKGLYNQVIMGVDNASDGDGIGNNDACVSVAKPGFKVEKGLAEGQAGQIELDENDEFEVKYLITVTNTGNVAGTFEDLSDEMSDELPAGASVESVTPSTIKGCDIGLNAPTVSYTHLTLPTTLHECRSRWSPYH